VKAVERVAVKHGFIELEVKDWSSCEGWQQFDSIESEPLFQCSSHPAASCLGVPQRELDRGSSLS
jgi:hypothetical protein